MWMELVMFIGGACFGFLIGFIYRGVCVEYSLEVKKGKMSIMDVPWWVELERDKGDEGCT